MLVDKENTKDIGLHFLGTIYSASVKNFIGIHPVAVEIFQPALKVTMASRKPGLVKNHFRYLIQCVKWMKILFEMSL